MNSKRLVWLARWCGAGFGLAALVFVFNALIHVNATTVALSFLLFILFLATKWGLRIAIVASFAAAACYNFFFLPPMHTFTVSDPQNLVALIALLTTSVVASRMSDRIRKESREALAKQSELEILYGLSKGLLQTEELSALTNVLPTTVSNACGARSALLFLLQGDKMYRHGADWPVQLGTLDMRALSQASSISVTTKAEECIIPLRIGVRPRGVLLLGGVRLSLLTLEAIGGLVSVSLDRARALEAVTRAEAAKESERLRMMMLDSITHEIRSPLTAIKVSIGTLKSMKLDEVGTSDLLSVIDEETDRLNRLVAQSVEMAQLDTLDVTMSFRASSLTEVIEAALQANETVLTGHPLKVSLGLDSNRVHIDTLWIQKLLGNILENAAKYSASAQPISVSSERKGEMVYVSVADRGNGIETSEQAQIFDKFYRSQDRNANVPGTGMGLAICRAIAEAHGGEIWVMSQPGNGSVFTFSVRAERMA